LIGGVTERQKVKEVPPSTIMERRGRGQEATRDFESWSVQKKERGFHDSGVEAM